jgi:hypothetical protein
MWVALNEVPLEPEKKGYGRYTGPSSILVTVIIAILLVAFVFYFLMPAINGPSVTSNSTSSSTSQSVIQGIVTGYVTVGPSQPACGANESTCTEDLSGYSLQFSPQCGTMGSGSSTLTCEELTYSAQIAPSGHHSILLAPGKYTITGLSPSCAWVGCASSFPESVLVEPGQQLVVNINIDTGIR